MFIRFKRNLPHKGMTYLISCIYSFSVMPNFANKVEEVVDQLGAQQSTDNDAFINASRLVYDGVCDIRRTVMLNRVRGDI